jgi:hypothetical protein
MTGARGAITSATLGYDAHGRKATLFSQRQADGSLHHSLRVDPRSFSEQGELVEGLTSDNLRAMARAVELLEK